jgi:hypothetical protein
VGLDGGLRPGLVGGAEPEPVRQHRLFQVTEIPLIELCPGTGVAQCGRIGLIPVRRPSLHGELIGGLRRHRALDASRHTVVPADHLVDQLAVAGMDLISQVGAGDVGHRPVAPPHLVGQIGPAPGDQIVTGAPQPAQPALAVGRVPFAPDPGQLSERGVAVHQVGTDGRNPLRQALHELHIRSGHETGIIHDASLCQGSAKPSTYFQGSAGLPRIA